ncbi:MAG: hypothetical protein ACR2J4_00575, partial [Deinococcus sp.]
AVLVKKRASVLKGAVLVKKRASVLKGAVLVKKRASVLKGAVLVKKACALQEEGHVIKSRQGRGVLGRTDALQDARPPPLDPRTSSESVLAEGARRKKIRILRHGIHGALFAECTQ